MRLSSGPTHGQCTSPVLSKLKLKIPSHPMAGASEPITVLLSALFQKFLFLKFGVLTFTQVF